MNLTDTGEVIWEQPRKEVVDLYHAGIAWHLYQHMDRVLSEPEQEEVK